MDFGGGAIEKLVFTASSIEFSFSLIQLFFSLLTISKMFSNLCIPNQVKSKGKAWSTF